MNRVRAMSSENVSGGDNQQERPGCCAVGCRLRRRRRLFQRSDLSESIGAKGFKEVQPWGSRLFWERRASMRCYLHWSRYFGCGQVGREPTDQDNHRQDRCGGSAVRRLDVISGPTASCRSSKHTRSVNGESGATSLAFSAAVVRLMDRR